MIFTKLQKFVKKVLGVVVVVVVLLPCWYAHNVDKSCVMNPYTILVVHRSQLIWDIFQYDFFTKLQKY